MHLSKLWSRYKGPIGWLLAMQGILISGLWSFDLQKLSPDTILTAQTIFDIRSGLSILSLLMCILFILCVFIYSFVATIRDKKALTIEMEYTVKSIKETVENNYTIHQRETLSPNIDKAMEEEGNKGFNLPQGLLAGRLFDIHLNEIFIFASIIREATLSFTSNPTISLSSPELLELFNELLIGHNAKIKTYHNSMITDLFSYNSSYTETMVDHFNKQAEIETRLRCKELLSALKIKNLSHCAAMVFPKWEPIKKEKPKPHVFVKEKMN